jgi:hypothetical protein
MSISFKFKLLIALGILGELSLRACAQPPVQQTLRFAAGAKQPVLVVDNLNGSIKVEAHAGSEVELEIRKTWKNEDPELQKEAQSQVKEVVEQAGDTLIVYVNNPQDDCCTRSQAGWRRRGSGARQRWYDYRFDFTVRVPKNTNLMLYTINHGDITVSNVEGKIEAHNINGGILLDKVGQVTRANTVNGSITVNFAGTPTQEARFKTVNGDIKLKCPADLAAEVNFKSMHGNLFTDFAATEPMANLVKKSEGNRGGTVYKLDRGQTVRIGGGGPTYYLETLNGNMYVQKN